MFRLEVIQQSLAVMNIILHNCPQKSSKSWPQKCREKTKMSWKVLKSPEILTVFLVRAIVRPLIEINSHAFVATNSRAPVNGNLSKTYFRCCCLKYVLFLKLTLAVVALLFHGNSFVEAYKRLLDVL